ncbi:hypothetical protein [Aureibaculum conchae]|uniref:hypothetical protein n=1 Tax=Aureibaculum sp. 2308TA14-22 TaxID=3108392 RepID=UPI003392A9B2
MSERTKLTSHEIEQQLLELKRLIETEPAPPSPEPIEGEIFMKQVRSDTEICGTMANIILLAHQQKNYENIGYADTKISEMEQDPTWSHPLIKRKIEYLRKMHTIVINNQSAGCMIALLISFSLSSVGYWLMI